jgi:putative DNA primase/helicase
MTFTAFAMSHGLIVDQIYPSPKIQRCATEDKPRSKNAAYMFDGLRGFIYRWDREARAIWWNDPSAQPWTDDEKRQFAERKRRDEESRQAGYRHAASIADAAIKACNASDHVYLRSKQLPAVLGLVNDAHELIVPMRNIVNNELAGAQTIRFLTETREWEKKMTYGMRAKDAVFRIGLRHAAETWLVEGYATGLTLELAMRRLSLPAAVLVCFSAGNMVRVSQQVSGRKFIFADNDKSGTGEKSAQETGIKYCMSTEVGEDANDMYARAGLMALCKLIVQTRAMT